MKNGLELIKGFVKGQNKDSLCFINDSPFLLNSSFLPPEVNQHGMHMACHMATHRSPNGDFATL